MPWGSSARYRLRRRLGDGGMGVVYEVDDRERDKVVALKMLSAPGAEALYRTKQEFRAIADLEHPNLVRLYDLTVTDHSCFFTMELVSGVDFVRHCASAADNANGGYVEERLRPALAQLALGLSALHAAGKVHCDVKPSNVLVSDSGRVVLLDFGLAKDMHVAGFESASNHVVGTAAYMSPEQARGERELTPATDWYAMGVMLFEVLTGRLPFQGGLLELLLAKQRDVPPPPSQLNPHVSSELDRLCVELMRFDPNQRLRGEEVLARLGLSSSDGVSATTSSLQADAAFVGRDSELAALRNAAADARAGRTVIAQVQGRSGMGKTTLVQRFLDLEDALIFGGRCYPQESIPYKAIDGIVDGLCRYLRGLPPEEVEALLPPGVESLSRLFPVLRRVKRIAALSARHGNLDVHPADARLRAFRCLRELLGALSRRRSLILVMDDVQWGDHDSAALLVDLLRGPNSMPVLLVATQRSNQVQGLPVLEALERIAGAGSENLLRVLVKVEPLSDEQSARAAARLLGRPNDVAAPDVQRIVREALGSPLMIGELSRVSESMFPRAPGAEEVSLADGLIVARLGTLSPKARCLVEVVALSGGPLPASVALRAADSHEHDRTLVHQLRAAHWLRALALDREDALDTFHDRMREAVIGSLSSSETQRLHARIAAVLETLENPPVDRLAYHLARAGETKRACRYALRAAEAAVAALAFERAAGLYRLASSLATTEEQTTFLPALAIALSYAGRTAEAAETHLSIAQRSSGAERLEHQRLAADNLLRSGQIDRPLELLGEVAGELGIGLTRRGTGALLTLLGRRMRVFLRGLNYTARRPDELSERTLTRLDTLGTVATSVSVADPVRGLVAQAAYLIDVLDAGEETRICRALMTEVAMHAMLGSDKKSERIAQRLRSIVERLDTPSTRLWLALAEALRAHGTFRFREAGARYLEVQQMCRQVPEITHWELTMARVYYYFCSAYYEGGYRTCTLDLEDVIEDARRRNDMHAYTLFNSSPLAYLRMAEDRPEAALANLDQLAEALPRELYYTHHFYAQHARSALLQYLGRHDEAADVAWQRRREAESAGLVRVLLVDTDSLFLVACSALSARRIEFARRTLRPMLRSNRAQVRGCAHLLEASAAALSSDLDAAHRQLRKAVVELELAGTHAWLATAQHRLGKLLGGAEGEALLAAARRWESAEGIVAPERMYAVHCPWPER
jgi:hypothetical protein